jgi:hypothetical protein
MQHWLMVDTLVVLAYGFQHSLLTTKSAVALFEKFLPIYLWNVLYSAISVVTLVKEGIKRYIRFPHHTCLIFFFWLHPVMTLDTLFLAIAATIYLYVGTYHQDLRGLRLIGNEWETYRHNTNLLLPTPRTLARMISDWRGEVESEPTVANKESRSAS